jgi:hypothetical protein
MQIPISPAPHEISFTDNEKIIINPARVVKRMFIIVSFLLIMHLISLFLNSTLQKQHLTEFFESHFNLAHEMSFPNFFSACLLLTASALLFYIPRVRTAKKKLKNKLYWIILGCLFLFLSLDEATQIHEELMVTVKERIFNRTGFDDLSGYLYMPWVIPYLLLVLVVGISFLKFLVHLEKRTRNLFIISGAVYITGALCLEMVEGHFAKYYGIDSAGYLFCVTVEEIMEMSGIIIFIYSLLDFLSPLTLRVNITAKKKMANETNPSFKKVSSPDL